MAIRFECDNCGKVLNDDNHVDIIVDLGTCEHHSEEEHQNRKIEDGHCCMEPVCFQKAMDKLYQKAFGAMGDVLFPAEEKTDE